MDMRIGIKIRRWFCRFGSLGWRTRYNYWRDWKCLEAGSQASFCWRGSAACFRPEYSRVVAAERGARWTRRSWWLWYSQRSMVWPTDSITNYYFTAIALPVTTISDHCLLNANWKDTIHMSSKERPPASRCERLLVRYALFCQLRNSKWWEKDQHSPPNKRTSTYSHNVSIVDDHTVRHRLQFRVPDGVLPISDSIASNTANQHSSKTFPTRVTWLWRPFVLSAIYPEMNNRRLVSYQQLISKEKGAWRQRWETQEKYHWPHEDWLHTFDLIYYFLDFAKYDTNKQLCYRGAHVGLTLHLFRIFARRSTSLLLGKERTLWMSFLRWHSEAPTAVLVYNELLLLLIADLNLNNVTMERDHYHTITWVIQIRNKNWQTAIMD